jgi:hypothetical protein
MKVIKNQWFVSLLLSIILFAVTFTPLASAADCDQCEWMNSFSFKCFQGSGGYEIHSNSSLEATFEWNRRCP